MNYLEMIRLHHGDEAVVMFDHDIAPLIGPHDVMILRPTETWNNKCRLYIYEAETNGNALYTAFWHRGAWHVLDRTNNDIALHVWMEKIING